MNIQPLFVFFLTDKEVKRRRKSMIPMPPFSPLNPSTLFYVKVFATYDIAGSGKIEFYELIEVWELN